MSSLSELRSRLNQCNSMKSKAEGTLGYVKIALNYYSSSLSYQFPRLVSQSNVFESSIGYINRPLSNCSGNKVSSIKSLVSGLAGYTGFSSQVSNLHADVDKSYSELTEKQDRLIDEIEHLESEISYLNQLISAEERRLAEEARKAAENADNDFKSRQADRL